MGRASGGDGADDGGGNADDGADVGGGAADAGDARKRRASDRSLHSDALPASAECPFCGGRDTEQFAAFGSAVSTSQYYCRRCRTVFEFMKWRE